MRKWFTLILLLLLAFPSAVQAQNAVTFESFNVRLWSEYDQPSMLVIYDFELAPDTTLPTKVDIRIPKDANITAVAYLEGSDLLNTEFTGPVEDGDWQIITYFAKTLTTYHLEYYQPIQRDGANRSFTYQWNGAYLVKNFRVEIQLPDDSTAVKATPMLPFVPNQPFLSGNASVSNLAAGKTYQVDLTYARVSEAPIVPSASQQVEAEPITQETSGRVTLDNLPYILAGVGVLLIVAAIFYFWRSNSVQAPKPRKRQHSAKGETSDVYCHECGARANGDDRFCRTCGSKLRTE